MPRGAHYRTRQHDALVSYLASRAGEHLTARDVCAHFKEIGQPIAPATVYRQMGTLVNEGVLRRFSPDSSAPACYEYVGEVEGCQLPSCIHLKCRSCGRLLHTHCDEIAAIQQHVAREHGFAWDVSDTVFVGSCDECRHREAEAGA